MPRIGDWAAVRRNASPPGSNYHSDYASTRPTNVEGELFPRATSFGHRHMPPPPQPPSSFDYSRPGRVNSRLRPDVTAYRPVRYPPSEPAWDGGRRTSWGLANEERNTSPVRRRHDRDLSRDRVTINENPGRIGIVDPPFRGNVVARHREWDSIDDDYLKHRSRSNYGPSIRSRSPLRTGRDRSRAPLYDDYELSSARLKQLRFQDDLLSQTGTHATNLDWDLVSRPFSQSAREEEDNFSLWLDDESDFEFEIGISLKDSLFSDSATSQSPSETDNNRRTSSRNSCRTNASTPRLSYHEESIYQVADTKLSGDVNEGNICAELVAERIDASIISHRRPPSVFKWIHVQNKVMNFSLFMDYVLQSPMLGPEDSKRLKGLMSRVRHRFEHTIPQGTNGKYLQPNLTQDSAKLNEFWSASAKVENGQFPIMFLCFPFFCVENYTGFCLPEKSTAHPLRSILQNKYPAIKKERDMLQAACRLGTLPRDHCFHVGQVWCLVLGDETVITCARDSLKDLSGDSITIQEIPAISAKLNDKSGSGKSGIRVSDGTSKVWILDTLYCETWFEFTAMFALLDNDDFEDSFDVLYKQAPIKAEDWPNVIREAQKTLVRLTLRRKAINMRARPATYDTSSTDSTTDVDESDSDATSSDSLSSSFKSLSSDSDTTQRTYQSMDNFHTVPVSLDARNTGRTVSDYNGMSPVLTPYPRSAEAATNDRFIETFGQPRVLGGNLERPVRSAMKKPNLNSSKMARAEDSVERLDSDDTSRPGPRRAASKDVRFERVRGDRTADLALGEQERSRTLHMETRSANVFEVEQGGFQPSRDSAWRPELIPSSNYHQTPSSLQSLKHIIALYQHSTSLSVDTLDPWVTEDAHIVQHFISSVQRWTVFEQDLLSPRNTKTLLRGDVKYWRDGERVLVSHADRDSAIEDLITCAKYENPDYTYGYTTQPYDRTDDDVHEIYDYILLCAHPDIGIRFQQDIRSHNDQLIPRGAKVYAVRYCGKSEWLEKVRTPGTIIVEFKGGCAYEQDFESELLMSASEWTLRDSKNATGTLAYQHRNRGMIQPENQAASALVLLMRLSRAIEEEVQNGPATSDDPRYASYRRKKTRRVDSRQPPGRGQGWPSATKTRGATESYESLLEPPLPFERYDLRTVEPQHRNSERYGQRRRTRTYGDNSAPRTFYSDGMNPPTEARTARNGEFRRKNASNRRYRSRASNSRATDISAHDATDVKLRFLPWLSGADLPLDTSKSPKQGSLQSSNFQTKVGAILSEADKALSNNKSRAEKRIYDRCSGSSYEQLCGSILSAKYALRRRGSPILGTKLALVKCACKIISCFTNVDSDAVIIRKCYYVLTRFLRDRRTSNTPVMVLRSFVARLKAILKTARKVCSQLSSSSSPTVWPTRARQAAAPAFIQALMSFTKAQILMTSLTDQAPYSGSAEQLQRSIERCLDSTVTSLQIGMLNIRKSLSQTLLEDNAAVLTLGVVTMLTGRLARDLTADKTDIMATYWTYFDKLDMEIRLNPLDRSHQERISHLIQEIGAIVPVLEDQLRVLDSLAIVALPDSSYHSRSRSSSTRLPGTIPNFAIGREGAVIAQSTRFIGARLESLRELQAYTADLSSWSIRMIESNKDRQESAILAFAVITVIFLPLSFVSSLFGMNTFDVRDMNQSQWLYWAVALPFTGVIVLLTLAWVGELEPLKRLASRLTLTRAKRKRQ